MLTRRGRSDWLVDAGHDCIHVQDRDLLGAPDDVVMATAAAESRALVSMDSDFGELLAMSTGATPCDAGQMVFNVNLGGGQSIFAQSSSRLNELDAELRAKHTGKPAEDIKPLVVLALRRIGISVSDAELVAYADAVSRGEKFQFHVS